jgi:hypothetical protein
MVVGLLIGFKIIFYLTITGFIFYFFKLYKKASFIVAISLIGSLSFTQAEESKKKKTIEKEDLLNEDIQLQIIKETVDSSSDSSTHQLPKGENESY